MKIEGARLKDFVRIDCFADGRFVREHCLCLAEHAATNAASAERGLQVRYPKKRIATTVSYPIGLAAVKEEGVGLVVEWSTEKPSELYDYPLAEIWMLHLIMKKGSEQPDEVIYAPAPVIRHTVTELAEMRPDLDWIPGADAPTSITPHGVGFNEASEDCEWYSPRLAAAIANRRAGSELLQLLGIRERSVPRFGRCNKCHKLSKSSGRRLQNRPRWVPANQAHICDCP